MRSHFFNYYRIDLHLQLQSVNELKSQRMLTYNTEGCDGGRGHPSDAPMSRCLAWPHHYSWWGRNRGRGGTRRRFLKSDRWQWNGSIRWRGAEEKPDGGKEMRELRRSGERAKKVMRQQSAPNFFLLRLQDFLLFLLLLLPQSWQKKTLREEKRAGICGKTIIQPVPNSFWHCQSRGELFLISCSSLDQ